MGTIYPRGASNGNRRVANNSEHIIPASTTTIPNALHEYILRTPRCLYTLVLYYEPHSLDLPQGLASDIGIAILIIISDLPRLFQGSPGLLLLNKSLIKHRLMRLLCTMRINNRVVLIIKRHQFLDFP